MIKYHDNMHGPMYGPDHMLTDNWSPADAVPGTFIRVFFRIDCPAFDAMHGHFPNDAARAAFYVDARAVLARFNVAEGIRMDYEPAREHLHIHPQNISGTIEACKVQPIAEALSACSSFTCRWVDLYEEISTMSNEEFTAHLDGQKQEIKSDLLRSYRIRAKEIRQMLGDKYTTLNDYVLVFEKLGAVRMIASILRSDHGEHETALDAEMLSTEVNEAFAAMQAKNNN